VLFYVVFVSVVLTKKSFFKDIIFIFKNQVMKKNLSTLILLCVSLFSLNSVAQTSTYNYTGGLQTYTVPVGITQISVDAKGARGGIGYYSNQGFGGRVQATVNVTPGQTYNIYVGNNGSVTGPNSVGGLGGNGNGHVGGNGTTGSTWSGGGGGGSTEIWLGATVVIVAGGGGGGSGDCSTDHGGQGGTAVAGNGLQCNVYTTVNCGAGGNTTTLTGGAAGTCGTASPGTLYNGGNAGSGTNWASGGGAGYYGGGGGCSTGAGGGGSSYPALAGGNIVAITHTLGNNNAQGQVLITPVCSGPVGGSIVGNAPICGLGNTLALSDPTGTTGGTWSTSNALVATVGAGTGVVTGVAPGTATITYSVTACSTTATASVTVTVNAATGSISGPSNTCMGSAPVTLTCTPSGGTWTSSAPTIATIVSGTGVLTNVAPGTTTITYNPGNGCSSATQVVTVNALPTLSGTTTVCATQTTTLSGTPSGGTFTSSSPALATVDPVTGVVTGVAAGTPSITYTSIPGCVSSTPVTVNPLSLITGVTSICNGATATLNDATPGGTWSSGNPSVATIGSSSGLVTSVSIGNAPISYTIASTGCRATTAVNITAPATAYAVTGGGAYCAGGAGVHIGVNSSDLGASYTLWLSGTQIGSPVVSALAGSAIDFGNITAAGTYTVIANVGNPCANTMTGSATIVVNPLPTGYSVTDGGAYCSGGTGVNVGLSSSSIGISYQLYYGLVATGSPLVGTGGALNFGLQTLASPPTYTVKGTDITTGCVNTMAGSASVSINPLPTVFAITGGGSYCLGGSGVLIGTSGSTVGVNYQLKLGGSPVGAAVAGTGSALNFGFQTTGGLYTVTATNTATSCSIDMSGPVTVTINPLPTVFNVTGGGAYCLGGAGVSIGLNGSTIGVNYQLYIGGSPVGGALIAGTGVAISFGLQTVIGSYTVVATNATTGCTNNMFGSATVAINPLPGVFSITGGGQYCVGGTGVHVGLSSSQIGVNYQLLNGLTAVGAASGTGAPIDFGLFTAAGTYSVVGTNSLTGCVGNMAGTVTITINPLPLLFTVGGGGSYCAGGAGLPITLSGSTVGVNYQLFNGPTAMGAPLAGTGGLLTFPVQTLAGSYTVVATNATTGCTNNMTGSAVITINPLPTVYAITGGGGYCAGGPGAVVGLSASNAGINYQLFLNGVTLVSAVAGTGSAIAFPAQTTAGTYTVVAVNPVTTCTSTMSGSTVISINPLPNVFTVSGGGSYCSGGAGLAVLVSGSTVGVNHQLFNGVTMIGAPIAGTGFPLNFGLQTLSGTYKDVATNATTGCSATMTGSAVISINPLPAVFSVSGGGSYCAGGPGMHVTLSGSVAGTTTYQLYNGVTAVGAPITGTGLGLDFGFRPAGSYTVVATITATGCNTPMSGTVVVSVNPLPGLYTVSGGGSYCAGGAGLHVLLSGSTIGINYQLFNGVTPVGAPIPGSSAAIDFGLLTGAGTYTVVATDVTTGCTATMTGSATILVNALPVLHAVTGGGSYCPGGSGLAIGLDGSNTGTNYQLYIGASPSGAPVAGNTGFPITFGLKTAAGIYTVVGTTGAGCNGNMTGSAAIGIYSLPIVYNMTGGGNYCSGGSGVNVGLSGSNIGINYQLYIGGVTPVGVPLAGTGLALNFGLQTAGGNYTVVATSASTGCSKNMNGTAVVNVNPLPTLYTVTGGGNYCAGGTGVVIGLSGSDFGTIYQLYNGITAMGTPVPGTGGAISFGSQTVAGTYTVVATNVSTTCINTMTGSVPVNIDALPTPYLVTGGGSYCSGTGGVSIFLSGSDAGITYQLYNGVTAVGAPQGGTGLSLTFGPVTAAGTYTIVGTDDATGCKKTMTGSVAVNINPLPTTYLVTGGGNYCAGGAGLHIYLSGSNAGISYQLMNGGPVGAPIPGTGMGLDFGLQTAGGTYTVVATNLSTMCTNNMTGSTNININPLPTAYTVVSTSSSYCIGGPGVYIALTGSDVGTSYQLYNGTTTVGSPVAGTGDSINFGYILPPGAYTVVATIVATGCSANMAPGVTITVHPLPTVYSVTGGGQYCSGGTGVDIGLSGSTPGTNYQLYRGINPVGSPMPGVGAALDFGLQTVAGVYTVVATTPLTTCTNNMSGSATVVINSLPLQTTVTGGGVYCAGGSGVVVGLNGSSTGVNYQLFRGVTPVGSPMAGTGAALNFGLQTGAGSYTVVATNAVTGCTSTMLSAAVVTINPLPTTFTMTGGGNYCPGGTGVHVGLSGSTLGVNYQLYNGTAMVGSPVSGTGSGLDFGLQTAAGSYTVVATDATTGCVNTMSGSVAVMINTLPVVYTVSGGGSYCAGGSGVHVGLNNSSIGVNYTLYGGPGGIVLIGTAAGVGGPLDFGVETLAGPYTVLATDATTSCSTYMSGSVNVTITPLVTPSVTIASGDTVCSGTFTTFTAVPVNGGGAPSYQWTVNGVTSGGGSAYSYTPSNGDVVNVTMTSSAACATPAMVSGSKTMVVNPSQSPMVTIAANPGNVVCQGTTVMFTATPTYGGTAPTYSWIKNGIAVGSSPTYSYTAMNHDVISCVMTSNYHCRLANTAASSAITMTVDLPLIPVVTITTNPGAYIAAGQTETLNTTVVNGGSAPMYQWYLNGVQIPGATASSYVSSNFADADSVTCQVTASGGCLGLVGFNSVIIHVHNVGVQQITAAGSDIQLVPNPNKGTFTVKGTLGTNIDEEVSIEVTNMLGQVIYTTKVVAKNGAINEKIQLNNTPANGMYMLNLRTTSENKVFHMVIEQ
jgi:uncharacterized protein YjdB